MISKQEKSKAIVLGDWAQYVFPFAVFLFLTAPVRLLPSYAGAFYITKTVLAGLLLFMWRHSYGHDLTGGLTATEGLLAVMCGLLVLVLWIAANGFLSFLGVNHGFHPFALTGSKAGAVVLACVRLLGAAVVVPITEELFWRSFLMRYLINRDFRSVPMGAFTWPSYLAVAALFGLEHHRVLEGIAARLLYGLLMVRQKKLLGAVLTHSITNLGLGIDVISAGNWGFW